MTKTLGEFRAWLEGFEEGFRWTCGTDSPPDSDQWRLIKEKLAEVEANERPHQTYIDSNGRPYRIMDAPLGTVGTPEHFAGLPHTWNSGQTFGYSLPSTGTTATAKVAKPFKGLD